MNVPLDNLYHYVEGLFFEPVCVYLFHPHGSRNILNLTPLNPLTKIEFGLDGVVLPQVVCNDQETLNYEFYQALSDDTLNYFSNQFQRNSHNFCLNLKAALALNIYDKTLLLHSEKNSPDLTQYEQDNYIGIYYWCHAVIARDWYRFAQHDRRLCHKSVDKNFLIYCRDWSGLREYRVKFQEMLYDRGLTKDSITGIKPVSGCNNTIDQFQFKNPNFAPVCTDFFYNLPNNQSESTLSADYVPQDFVNTNISVVLETVFDGPKIHLTEKILRPIACGHPFILAAGPGSLQYLRSYGFKTFSPWINEDYDLETNSVNRLEKIIDSMQAFADLPTTVQCTTIEQINKIADYNKQWFFSDDFAAMINCELTANINTALAAVKKTRCNTFRSVSVDKKHSNKQAKHGLRKIIADYIKNLKKLNPV